MINNKTRRQRPVLSTFQRFARAEYFSGILLLLATLVAMLWANSPWKETYSAIWATKITVGIGDFAISKSFFLWINDGLMAVFFFVVGLEIKREILVGELSSPRQAVFPIAAALGGMAVPALFYTLVNVGGPGEPGWGVPMATDIAFALGILSLLGKRAPLSLKIFLTAVAIVDDIGAVLVIAIFYSENIVMANLIAAGVILLLLFGLNRAQVRSPLPYAILGIFLWVALLTSGVHATIAGVLLAITIPAKQKIDSENFVRRSRNLVDGFENAGEAGKATLPNKDQRSFLTSMERNVEHVRAPLQRLEHLLHPYVSYGIMPLFALANAGVSLGSGFSAALTDKISIGIILGLVLGKQLGISLSAWLVTRLGWAERPAGISWWQIYGVAWLAGIGFTMALFVSDLAFPSNEMLETAKVGILTASLICAIGGSIILSRVRVNRKSKT
jgi:NhaA family Na+:H+ antiporter